MIAHLVKLVVLAGEWWKGGERVDVISGLQNSGERRGLYSAGFNLLAVGVLKLGLGLVGRARVEERRREFRPMRTLNRGFLGAWRA